MANASQKNNMSKDTTDEPRFVYAEFAGDTKGGNVEFQINNVSAPEIAILIATLYDVIEDRKDRTIIHGFVEEFLKSGKPLEEFQFDTKELSQPN